MRVADKPQRFMPYCLPDSICDAPGGGRSTIEKWELWVGLVAGIVGLGASGVTIATYFK